MKVVHILTIFILFFFACLIANADENKQYKLKNAFRNLSFDNPVDLQHAGDETNRIFVVSQMGLIYVFKEEIYAYGLRNPWRFNFDPVTGL